MHVEVRGQLAAMTPPSSVWIPGDPTQVVRPSGKQVPLHAEHLTSPSVGIYLSYFMN